MGAEGRHESCSKFRYGRRLLESGRLNRKRPNRTQVIGSFKKNEPGRFHGSYCDRMPIHMQERQELPPPNRTALEPDAQTGINVVGKVIVLPRLGVVINEYSHGQIRGGEEGVQSHTNHGEVPLGFARLNRK